MISKKSSGPAKTNLFLRDFPAALVRRAKAAAALRDVTLSRFVAESLEATLGRGSEQPTRAGHVPADIRAAERWYDHNRAQLQIYRDEYLAITEGGLIDHDCDLQRLTDRVWTKIGYRPIFTPRVGEPAVHRLRSPRRIR